MHKHLSVIIGIDARCLTTPHLTGIERLTARLLQHWPDQGSRCIAYTDKPVRFAMHSVEIRTLRSFSPAAWFHVQLPIALYRDRVNVFLSPVTMLPAWLPARVRPAVIAYDFAYMHYPEFYSRRELTILHTKTDRAIRHAELVIVISRSTLRDLQQFYPEVSNHSRCIYPAADPPVPSHASAVLQQLARPFLLTIGTAYGRKNLQLLVPTLHILRKRFGHPITAVMTGKRGFAEEAVLDEARKQGIGDAVVHLGFVSDEEKAWLFSNAAAFFFPSLYEGFGIPVLEAMRYGCPVVCANTSSLPEVGGDGALYFDPHDAAAAAAAVHRLLTETGFRNDLIRRGGENCKRFSWQAMARAYHDALMTLQP